MGPGIAIEPTDDVVTAPADGTVESVFPTGHAIGLRLNDGTELLIHIGIDTVSMKGDGFETLVAAGDVVKTGDPLVRFDRDRIAAAGHATVTPMIVLNNPDATIELE
jgi:PTS system N-acetylglucosamine-specific IIC component